MIRIRAMQPGDIALGAEISAEAGWNQTVADWERLLALAGDGAFVACIDGRPAGTALAFVHGELGWIGMVLVRASDRRRGLGRALVERAVAWLDERGVATMGLDATASGRPLYESLGFGASMEVLRFDGQALSSSTDSGVARVGESEATEIVPAREEESPQLLRLDRESTGVDRASLVRSLLRAPGSRAWIARRSGLAVGHVLRRPGRLATQIGPCIASSPGTGVRLLEIALAASPGEAVFVDVPEANQPALDVLRSRGLRVVRRFVRMTRGQVPHERIERVFASSGPETG